MTQHKAVQQQASQASLPLTFEQEIAQIAATRGADIDVQSLVRQAVKRHADAGAICLTDLLLMPDRGLKFFAVSMAQGLVYEPREQKLLASAEVGAEESPWPSVLLCSLMRDADGKAFRAPPPLKTDRPPRQQSVAHNRLWDVTGRDRYDKVTFDVDPATGKFRKTVSVTAACVMLGLCGMSVRLPRYSTRWLGHPRQGGREVRVDEWAIAEWAWLEKNRELVEQAAPKVEAPVVVLG
jgi:hypothetical protein